MSNDPPQNHPQMFKRTKPITVALWKRFRSYPLFLQLLLVVPIICAMALTLLVGNMGLALMGTAVAINSVVAGWFGGVFLLILGKAGRKRPVSLL